MLEVPEVSPAIPRRLVILTVVVALILIGGVAGLLIALKRAENLATARKAAQAVRAEQPAEANPVAGTTVNGFALGPIRIQRTAGGVAHVTGTVRNTQMQPRRQVSIRLALRDASGLPAGIALDSTPLIEPGAEWVFNARVLVTNAASARLVSIESAP